MTILSIILTTYNRSVDLVRTLQAYERQTCLHQSEATADSEKEYFPFEILVIDDASTDATWEKLQNYHPQNYRLRIERMERNSGPGKARNRAIPLVSSPLILFTGDDMLPENTFVAAHLAIHRKFSDEKVAVLGRIQWPNDLPINTLMSHIDGVGAQQFSYHYLKDGEEYDFRHLYTSNISLKTSMLHSLERYFDPDFTSAAFEDADLGYRLAQKGLRIRYSSLPVVNHYHYHNVYSFSRRQYSSGKMACILVKKHPELSKLIYGKGLKFYLLKAKIKAHFIRMKYSSARMYSSALIREVEQLDGKLLRLLNYYENKSQPLLDSLYIKSFQYYLFKGILEGNIPHGSTGSTLPHLPHGQDSMSLETATIALERLTEIFTWYIPLAKKMGILLPEGF